MPMRLELLIVKVFAVKKGGYLVALFYLSDAKKAMSPLSVENSFFLKPSLAGEGWVRRG